MSKSSLVGRTLGHYEIVAFLGKGGFGEVYKARDCRLDRFVAIKVLPSALEGDSQKLDRFQREARAVAALNHPNIVTLHSVEEVEGVRFLTMELVEGLPLTDLIPEGGISLDMFFDLVIDMVDALGAAHQHGVIHRDLKPANMMRDRHDRIKILDFGLAKLKVGADPSPIAGDSPTEMETREGHLLGTAAYMSPEQLLGEPADQRSDLFSLGVIFQELLIGERPFQRATMPAVLAAILHEKPQSVTEVRSVPQTLADIIARCLEKDPDNRFQTAQELHQALMSVERELEETRILGQRRPTAERTAKRKSGRWVFLASTITLSLILGLLAMTWWRHLEGDALEERSAHGPRIAVLPLANLGEAEEDYFAAGMTEEITSRLARVSALCVISRTSTRHYFETDKSIKEIGEELDVAYVLEGTVRWGGTGRIRMTPRLIRVADDLLVWTQIYDRVIDDVFAVQSQIAQQIVQQLGVTLLEAEHLSEETRPTENLQAYQAYLRGRYYAGLPHFTFQNWNLALENYQEAVAFDPDFAWAHAELGRAHALLYFYRYDISPERCTLATNSIDRAVQLAPELPRVRLCVAYVLFWVHREYQQALGELAFVEKAIPNNAEVLKAQGRILETQGHFDQALACYKQAFGLSPRDAGLPTFIAGAAWLTRDYPRARDACDQAIALAPDQLWPHLYRIFNQWSWRGAGPESRDMLETLPNPNGSWAQWTWYWQFMFEGECHQALESLSSKKGDWIRTKISARPKSLFEAFVYEQLKDPTRAALAYKSAKEVLEVAVREQPDDPRLHSSLGIALAALGFKERAIEEGRLAVTLLPTSIDAVYGLSFVVDLAHIITLVGDTDAALDLLENLLSSPSWFSGPFLRKDPRWDSLREIQGFQQLLETSEQKITGSGESTVR